MQLGADIDGEAAGDIAGQSVSLNSDGSIVAVGAPFNDGNGTLAGHVRVFQNVAGTWTQIDADIDGEAAGDQSGYGVSISPDGSTVAIGGPFNDGSGLDAGHVRVYRSKSLAISDLSKAGISIHPNPTKGMINLDFSQSRSAEISIYDATGKRIYDKQLSIGNKQLKVDLSTFESGIYMVAIRVDGELYASKILVSSN